MAEYQENFQAIAVWLQGKRCAEDYAPSDWRGKPVYVVEFLKGRYADMLSRGLAVQLEELMLAETLASGHSDYHHKLALYLTEIEQGRFSTGRV